MGIIVNDAEIKAAIGEVGATLSDSQIAVILSFLPGVISAVKNYIGYDPVYTQDRVQYFPLSDDRFDDEYLLLQHLPVRSIASIYEDYSGRFGQKSGAFAASTLLTAGTDYALEIDSGTVSQSGHVVRYGTTWCSNPGSIKVTYTSGFKEDEFRGVSGVGVDASGIKSAVLLTMQKIFKTVTNQTLLTGAKAQGAIASERAGDYSVSFNAQAIESLTAQKIQLSNEALAYLEPFISYNGLGL